MYIQYPTPRLRYAWYSDDLRHNWCRNHQREQRMRDLCRCKHCRLACGVVDGGDLDYVGPHDGQTAQSVQNGEQLARREATWFGCASCCRKDGCVSQVKVRVDRYSGVSLCRMVNLPGA